MARHNRNVDLVFGELLLLILDNSTTSDLLEFRLVNRNWKEVATKVLLKRGSLEIQFGLHDEFFQCKINGKRDYTFYAFKKAEMRLAHSGCHCDLQEEMLGARTLPDFLNLVASPSNPSSSTPLCLSSSCSLPVNNFGFHIEDFRPDSDLRYDYEDTTHPHLLSFVQIFGHKLKTLTLNSFVHYFEGHPGMPDFFLQYLPNLESLYIRDEYNRSFVNLEDEPLNILDMGENSKFSLEHLKFVELAPCYWENHSLSRATYDILSHLLKISPRLQRISFPFFDDLNIIKVFPPSKENLLYIETLKLISDYIFSEDLEDLENFENLVEMMTRMDRSRPQGVGLKRFRLLVNCWPDTLASWKRGAANLRRIFQLNQNSLEHLILGGGAASIIYKIPGLPTLPNVTKLLVKMDSLNWEYHHPKDDDAFTIEDDDGSLQRQENSLSVLFPNLQEVGLLLPDAIFDESAYYKNWIPFWNQKLRQVKSLTVLNVRAPSVFAKIFKLFPDLNSFSPREWRSRKFFHRMPFLPSCNLSQLTSLNLKFKLGYNGFLDVDATLTGLSVETVRTIYNNWKQCGEWEAPKEWERPLLRANSSILDLENLKKLQLDFDFDSDSATSMVISGVSVKFGFDLMPNLRVLVLCKVYTSMPACVERDPKWAAEKQRLLELNKCLLPFPNVNLDFGILKE